MTPNMILHHQPRLRLAKLKIVLFGTITAVAFMVELGQFLLQA